MNPVAAAVEERPAGTGAEAGITTRPHNTARGKHDGALGLRQDWARLTGHTVEVWLRGEYVASGVVEQAAEDDSVLWLAGRGADTRRLFDQGTGYQVWV